MIEQRTLAKPGEGIMPPETSPTEHNEYPKHMVHAGFAPGVVGEEVKSPHGFTYHMPGQAIRYPPVLAMTAAQEEYHRSQGYTSIGKSDPAAFARAVASAAPPVLDYKPQEYPKWVAGKTVNNAEEEAEALGTSIVQAGGNMAAVAASVASDAAPAQTDEDRATEEDARLKVAQAEDAAKDATKTAE